MREWEAIKIGVEIPPRDLEAEAAEARNWGGGAQRQDNRPVGMQTVGKKGGKTLQEIMAAENPMGQDMGVNTVQGRPDMTTTARRSDRDAGNTMGQYTVQGAVAADPVGSQTMAQSTKFDRRQTGQGQCAVAADSYSPPTTPRGNQGSGRGGRS
jgi:hypothetical protein